MSAGTGILPDSTLIAIRVAEDNGTLRDTLVDEAQRLMQTPVGSSGVSQDLLGTVVWLSLISLTAIGIVTFTMVFIMPKFKQIFEDFGVELPAATQQLIRVSDLVADIWPVLVLPVVTLSGGMLAFAIWASMLRLQRGILPWSQHWPRFWIPDILRLLSSTVAAGRPLSGALFGILREMQPGRAATRVSGLRVMVDSGHDCIDGMQQLRLLKPQEAAFLKAATATRHLDWALQHLSRSIRRRQQQWLGRLQRLLQPLAILFVGAIVGLIVVALFLPLIKLLHDLS